MVSIAGLGASTATAQPNFISKIFIPESTVEGMSVSSDSLDADESTLTTEDTVESLSNDVDDVSRAASDDEGEVDSDRVSSRGADDSLLGENEGDEDEREDEDEDDDSWSRGSRSSTAGVVPATSTSAPRPTSGAGTNGVAPVTANSKTFSMSDVAKHNTKSSCYTVVGGSVYDLTSFVSAHPGGQAAIASLCGVDGTTSFTAQHGGQRRPENELAGLKIGVLVP